MKKLLIFIVLITSFCRFAAAQQMAPVVQSVSGTAVSGIASQADSVHVFVQIGDSTHLLGKAPVSSQQNWSLSSQEFNPALSLNSVNSVQALSVNTSGGTISGVSQFVPSGCTVTISADLYSLCPGDQTTISPISALSNVNSYQWYRVTEGGDVPVGTNPTLTTSQTGTYFLVADFSQLVIGSSGTSQQAFTLSTIGQTCMGSVTSDSVTITSITVTPPVITGNGNLCSGGSDTLSVNLSGNESVIQWNLNGNAISGSEGQTQIVVQKAGNYTVEIYNEPCTITSQAFTIHTLTQTPQIQTSGSDCINQPILFSLSNIAQIDLADITWTFGNGDYSYLSTPTEMYRQTGSYTVEVDINKCVTGELIVNGNFETKPSLAFEQSICSSTTTACTPSTTAFDSLGFKSEVPFRYDWGAYNTFRIRQGNGPDAVNGYLNNEGTNRYLLVDGKEGDSFTALNCWYQQIRVEPETEYKFSCRAANATFADQSNPPKVDFGILVDSVGILKFQTMFKSGTITLDGVVQNNSSQGISLGANTKNWREVSGTFKTGSTDTNVYLSIRSIAASGFGNDFAIDDISLQRVCNDVGLCQYSFTKEITINNCDSTCLGCITSLSPLRGKQYVLSAWVKENMTGVTGYTHTSLNITFENSNVTYTHFVPKGQIIDGWQQVEDTFSIPQSATKIYIKVLNKSASVAAFVDDIRIHPFNSSMKSYVYDPRTFRLMAELDERNYATFYEYDEEGALVRVKKETERGIMTIQESRNSKVKKPNP